MIPLPLTIGFCIKQKPSEKTRIQPPKGLQFNNEVFEDGSQGEVSNGFDLNVATLPNQISI